MQVRLEKFGNLNIKYIVSLFKLYKDIKYTSWDRLYFEVEAEDINSAVQKIVDGDVDEYDVEGLDVYETLTPEENNDFSTIEIFSNTGELLYKNGE